MTSKRALKITSKSRQREYYSDFMRDFDLNPITGALERLTNTESIKQSIENLVLTQKGERFYHPDVGSDILRSLFENFETLTEISIQESISLVIQQHEPRARNVNVLVIPDIANNNYVVNISFSEINIPNITQTMTIILNRVR